MNLPGLAVMAGLAAVWEAAVRTGFLAYQFLPAPSGVAQATTGLVASGALVENLLHTLRVTLLSWVIAGVSGLGLGLLLGLSDRAWRYSMASVEVIRAIPPVTLVPVAVLMFGFSIRMELTITVFVSTWPVLVNVISGTRHVPPGLLDVARTMQLSRVRTVTKVILPAAVPSIVVGLRLALSLSLVLAVVAEMIGNPAGLGNALIRSQQSLQPERMFAYVLTIGLLGVLLNAGLRRFARAVVPSLAMDGPGRDG